MALESSTYISGLVVTNPTSSDNVGDGDNHIRLLKSTIRATFPNIDGALTATHTAIDGAVTATTDATSANTASKIVARDSSGNFSAGTVTAALSGNASTASRWATARTISLTGDVTGSASIRGDANASITATVANNSHDHTIDNVTGMQSALNGKVDNSRVLTDVPANAQFVNTTYSVGNGGLTQINFTSALNSKLSGIAAGAQVNPSNATIQAAAAGCAAGSVDGYSISQSATGSTTNTIYFRT